MRARDIAALGAGVLFGVGLCAAGMTDPNKVKNFLDFSGSWDPSLALVMGAGLLVTTPGFRWVLRQRGPVWATAFQLPRSTDLDARLIGGSAVFGIGWALGGFCPGPAVTSLANGSLGAFLVIAAMVAGAALHDHTLGAPKKLSPAPSYPAVSG